MNYSIFERIIYKKKVWVGDGLTAIVENNLKKKKFNIHSEKKNYYKRLATELWFMCILIALYSIMPELIREKLKKERRK